MSTDISSYTFTNGTKVSEWINSLPEDDRERAAQCVREFVDEHKPLNLLQVKIRMTAPKPVINEFDDDEPTPLPEPTPEQETAQEPEKDFYNSSQPLRPTVSEAEPQVRSHSPMRWLKVTLIVVATILLAAFATNPGETQHKQEISSVVTAVAQNSLSNILDNTAFGGILGSMFQPMFTDQILHSVTSALLDSNLHYHNYLFWSTTSCRLGDKEHTTSIGLFGMVFTINQDDLQEDVDSMLESINIF